MERLLADALNEKLGFWFYSERLLADAFKAENNLFDLIWSGSFADAHNEKLGIWLDSERLLADAFLSTD